MTKPLHALLNSGLMIACLLTLAAPLKPSLKTPLVLTLAIAAQRHAQKQELLVRHYQTGWSTACHAALQESRESLTWLQTYLPAPNPERPKGVLQRIALDGWRELSQGNSPVPNLYRQFQRQYIAFAANKREGKTSAAHYGISLWLDADPSLLLYIFDPNRGMNNDPKFAPTWLGIPELDRLPTNELCTGAFKGKPEDLEPFIDAAIALLDQRINSASRTPSVLVGIDELTNQLPQLDEKSRNRIITKLTTLATQGDKHGIYLWIILHTITKEETCLDRVFLRQFHLVLGVELSQDKTVLSNAPRLLPTQAIAQGQTQYRQSGLPAGFVTSLPIAQGYLPPPPLPDGLKGLERDWGDSPQSKLQFLFDERLDLPEVQAAIQLYRLGQLKTKGGEKPKQQLFRTVWGYPLNGKRKAEQAILNRHLEFLAEAANRNDLDPVTDSPSDNATPIATSIPTDIPTAIAIAEPNGNGHHPIAAI